MSPYGDIVKALLSLQKKKSYLKELCGKSIVDILEKVSIHKFIVTF